MNLGQPTSTSEARCSSNLVEISPRVKRGAYGLLFNPPLRVKQEAEGILVNPSPRVKREAQVILLTYHLE